RTPAPRSWRAACASTGAALPARSRWRASGDAGRPRVVRGRCRRRAAGGGQQRAPRLRPRPGIPSLAGERLSRPARAGGEGARRAHRAVPRLASRQGAAALCAALGRSGPAPGRWPVARGPELGVRCPDAAREGGLARRRDADCAAARPARRGADRIPGASPCRRQPQIRAREPAGQRGRSPPAARAADAGPSGGMGGQADAGAGRACEALRRARAADRRAARARPRAPAEGAGRDGAQARGAQAPARPRGAVATGPRPGLRRRQRGVAPGVLRAAARHRSHAHLRAARARDGEFPPLCPGLYRAGEPRRRDVLPHPVNDPVPARGIGEALEQPPASYAGRTRHTQLEFEAILANATLGIAFTRDRLFYLCNPKFAEVLGYAPEELIGQPGEMVYVSKESYEALGRIALPILASGRPLDVEWEFRRKDGSIFIARVIARAVSEKNTQQATVWIIEDVSERRRHADEVARLLREQEASLGTAAVGVVFVRDKRVVRCNRRYEQMYGYGPGELDGQLTRIIYPNDEEYDAAQAGDHHLPRRETARRIGRRLRKDGSTFLNRADGRAVDPRNAQRGVVWTVEDVTEQRRAEEQRQRGLAEQQALIDNVSVGIAFRRDRRTVRCNRRYEEMFGYAAGEAAGTSTRDIYFTDEEYSQAS